VVKKSLYVAITTASNQSDSYIFPLSTYVHVKDPCVSPRLHLALLRKGLQIGPFRCLHQLDVDCFRPVLKFINEKCIQEKIQVKARKSKINSWRNNKSN